MVGSGLGVEKQTAHKLWTAQQHFTAGRNVKEGLGKIFFFYCVWIHWQGFASLKAHHCSVLTTSIQKHLDYIKTVQNSSKELVRLWWLSKDQDKWLEHWMNKWLIERVLNIISFFRLISFIQLLKPALREIKTLNKFTLAV